MSSTLYVSIAYPDNNRAFYLDNMILIDPIIKK